MLDIMIDCRQRAGLDVKELPQLAAWREGVRKIMNLMRHIEDKTARVGVVGLGYVGLPLAVEIAGAGYPTLGFDVDPSRAQMVAGGKNPVEDVDSDKLASLVREGRLSATSDFDRMTECEVFIVCVPTPLDTYKVPDTSYILRAAGEIAKRLRSDTLVILESTTWPGTTQELVLPILEAPGLKAGQDFSLAFSPERVDPGNARFRTANIPKIVGGCTPRCTRHAEAFYGRVLDAAIHTVSSPREAEMAKIFENTFRVVNCALANEFAVVCEKLGIDVWEVIAAASTKPFGFLPFYPGPGVGGHCIPIDPFYLTYRARAIDYHTKLIELAGEINDSMPEYVVNRVQDLLSYRGTTLRGASVLLSGVAYKGDISDVRESPAFKVWEHLVYKGAEVSYCDPFCPSVRFHGEEVRAVELDASQAERADVIVVTTSHTKGVDYDLMYRHANLIFDTKNVVEKMLDPATPRRPDVLHKI